MDKEIETVMTWVNNQLSKGMPPRLSEVLSYAYKNLGFTHIKKSKIAQALRLQKSYVMTSSQQRQPKRSKKRRMILTESLGHLHADIFYIGLSKNYSTPKTFQAGVLLAIDVLSRYKYAVILKGSKSAPSIVKAFTDLIKQHDAQFSHRIKSISFDQETSVMSKLVQEFFKQESITFKYFDFTSSKSKLAENSIRYLRNAVARLMTDDPSRRWWQFLPELIDSFNKQPIRINNKSLPWRPIDVTVETLEAFLADLYKVAPVYYHAQFPIATQLVNFKYKVGTLVRVKKIVSSSAVLEKRSEISLESSLFEVVEQIAYINKAKKISLCYRCINIKTKQIEIFDQDEITESL